MLANTLAEFSEDLTYRFLLQRDAAPFLSGVCTFIMLNPSIADEHRNDPTVRKCIGFTQRLGMRWLRVVNLSPYRATDPQDLRAQGPEPEDVWARNIDTIKAALSGADLAIAAWGTHGVWEKRESRVREALAGFDLHCLGLTKGGQPWHPLLLRYDALLRPLP